MTIEDKTKIEEYCKLGLVAWPEFSTGKTHFYKGLTQDKKKVKVGDCSGTWMEYRNVGDKYPQIIEAQCDICHEKEIGCFGKG